MTAQMRVFVYILNLAYECPKVQFAGFRQIVIALVSFQSERKAIFELRHAHTCAQRAHAHSLDRIITRSEVANDSVSGESPDQTAHAQSDQDLRCPHLSRRYHFARLHFSLMGFTGFSCCSLYIHVASWNKQTKTFIRITR